nr:EAL domain-containing protein [Candidatus Nanopelagicales bacterium]
QDGRIFDLNPVAESVLELDHDAMIGESFDQVLRPADRLDPTISELKSALSDGRNWRNSDTHLVSQTGRSLSASLLFRAMETGGGVLAIEDITERKQAQAELLWRANHDSLTGLLNRPALIDQINRALQRARRYGHRLAVMFIDLDRFKRVNDTLGHAAGDVLLVDCAKRITSVMREVDTVARLGGDEFVIVCENLTRSEDAREVAQRVTRMVAEPFSIDGDLAYVEASIGIAMSDGRNVTPDELLRDADIALYEAKQRHGSAVTLYTEAMIHRMQHSLQLERKLRRALYTDEFWVAYQPIRTLGQSQVIGFEALARWTTPEGPVAPEEFIATAEAAGLLNDLGRRLIESSLQFQTRLPPEQLLFINMAPGQIAADGIVEWLDAAIGRTGADPSRLFIEVTETAAMHDRLIALRLAALRERGLRIALDDFGVGHSSLASIRSLPLDLIKADRSFLVSTRGDPRAQAIARMVCDLGGALGVDVIAEGIETEEQRSFIAELGCNLGQGFLLGGPRPADEALAYLD